MGLSRETRIVCRPTKLAELFNQRRYLIRRVVPNVPYLINVYCISLFISNVTSSTNISNKPFLPVSQTKVKHHGCLIFVARQLNQLEVELLSSSDISSKPSCDVLLSHKRIIYSRWH